MYPFAYGNALDTMIFRNSELMFRDNKMKSLNAAHYATTTRNALVSFKSGCAQKSGSVIADWSSTKLLNLCLLLAWW